ncbi:MAG: S23 ribosomal protein [Microgenomates group bacterium Gr01-1014_93]|nr:MAG: S23 ribosomal protein [Microgenomates group bacterium Gr01-1014_93]
MNNNEFKRQLITRAFTFAREIISLVDKFPNKRSAWVISDQLLRAATSVGANIIEAQSASSKKDFINFLNYALKSGNETKFWLALAKDILPDSIEKINKLVGEIDELTKILGSSISTLKNK